MMLFPLLAFAATALALLAGRKAALKCGYADRPGGRKLHDRPIPPIGGLAIIPVFLCVSTLAGFSNFLTWPLAVGLLTLLLMGAIDDTRPIHPWVKFIIMVWTACFVVIFGEAQIGQLGNLFGFGMVELGFLSKGFTIMCLVLLMNAINMMDGVDGLSGGFCALVVFWMMMACAGAGQWTPFWTLSILFGCLAAFLIFNMRSPLRRGASVFMGDAGALCLGLLLGWFCIRLTQGSEAPLEPVTTIWIIAVPVMDAFALFLTRSLHGLHPFHADRRHLHHTFLNAGFTPGMTTMVILALIAVFALIGFMAQAKDVPEAVMFYLWMLLFGLHTAIIMRPEGYKRFRFFAERSAS
jgi:UDP-GlcNAc:undecaprenyl-phosphate GlcNAc-1-phosphate transferase